MKKVTLKDESWENEHHTLEACLKDTGDLVLEGYDLGDSVKKYYGDIDFEYWHTVKAENVSDVLLQLIKEKFKSAKEFLQWLEEKEIPYKSTSF